MGDMPMAKIFISYRREDAGFAVDQVHAALKPYAEIPSDIFIDVDNIPPGVDFVEHLESKVSQCEIMLVAIGLRWLDATNESGQQRLSDPDDFVRIEIEAALARGIPVVPILIGGAAMPHISNLPESLQPLVRRQAVKIERGKVQQAVDEMMRRMGLEKKNATEASTPPVRSSRRMGLYAALGLVVLGVASVLLWRNDAGTTQLASDENTFSNEPEVIRLQRENCNEGILRECTDLGFKYENGDGVPVDYNKAFQLYRQACDGGHPLGCNNLGYYHELGRVVKTDFAEAIRLYHFACVRGEPYGCTNLENVYEDIRSAREACKTGNMQQCTYFGFQYEEGDRLPQNYQKALEFYRQACDSGNSTGCNNLGFYHELGRVVQKDDEEAARLYDFACKGGEPLGCINLEKLRGSQ